MLMAAIIYKSTNKSSLVYSLWDLLGCMNVSSLSRMKILAETIYLKNVQYRSVLAPDLFSSSALLWAATPTIDLHTGYI